MRSELKLYHHSSVYSVCNFQAGLQFVISVTYRKIVRSYSSTKCTQVALRYSHTLEENMLFSNEMSTFFSDMMKSSRLLDLERKLLMLDVALEEKAFTI